MFICTRLFPQSYQYSNLSEGTDSVSGQLHGEKDCPLSDVTKSGRVWRKVPESDAWSVCIVMSWINCISIGFLHKSAKCRKSYFRATVVFGIQGS